MRGAFPQEVYAMLPARGSPRKRSTRNPFRTPRWDEDDAEFRRIDAELAPNHHARWLKTAVARLDLEPLRRAYANRGSLAYPPEQLLPFVLYLYSEGQSSPAKWAAAARGTDACKWLLLGLRPCRSQLYTFRDRLEPFLDSWHKQLIDWAKAEGITTAKRGSLDGTLIASLSSRHRLLSRRVVDGRLLLLFLAVCVDERPTEEVLRLIATLLAAALLGEPLYLLSALLLLLLLHEQPEAVRPEVLPVWLPASAAGRARLLKRLHKAQQRQQERVKPLQGKKRLSKKDEKALRVKINPSDTDAVLGFDKKGTYRPLFNLQTVKATDANLILSWELYCRNNDDGLLQPMMKQTHKQLGHHLDEVIVDGAFISIGDVVYCEKHSITVYAPPAKQEQAKPAAPPTRPAATSSPAEPDKRHAATVRAPSSAPSIQEQAGTDEQKEKAKPPRGAAGKKAELAKKYGKEKFRYDAEQKSYHCPAGKVLKEVFRTSEERPGGVELTVLVHRAESSDCQGCARREQCTTGKKGRVVKRYEGEEALERLTGRMQEPANKAVYRLRGQTVEPGFGELKTHRGLDEFRCFGRMRSRCQAGLTILATNALSIVRALRRRGSATRPPPSDDFEAA
jgi:transposase